MKSRWTRWLVAAAAMLVFSGLSVPRAFADDSPRDKLPGPTQQDEGEQKPLTPAEQAKRDLLKQKWTDIKGVHDAAQQEAHKLHDDLKRLHDLVNQAKEAGDKEKLKALKGEEKTLQEQLKHVHDLRAELKQLHVQLKHYKEAKDFDDALKTMDQMKPVMRQYHDALRAADEQVQRMITKMS